MKLSQHNYLNVFTENNAIRMINDCLDYWEAPNDMLLVVACDNTVWVCKPTDSVSLSNCTLIQRVL